MKLATTRIRLKGFEKADTSSQFEGRLDPGRYVVDEYLENHPDSSTDFALVQAPTLGAGDTWICTRWKDQVYASIEEVVREPAARRSFDDESAAISESALLERLTDFSDFSYDLDDARYPWPLKGVNVPQSPPSTNNCCTFVEALLVKAWVDQDPGFDWDAHRHRQMMIMSSDDFFSPVTAAVESGMAVAVADPDEPPNPWTIVQGWRRQWRGGHTFLIADYHEATDRVLTLESNSSYKLNGIGFRAIGNLKEVGGEPPDQWWEIDGVWTWQKICSTYQFRQQAMLRVKDRNWSAG